MAQASANGGHDFHDTSITGSGRTHLGNHYQGPVYNGAVYIYASTTGDGRTATRCISFDFGACISSIMDAYRRWDSACGHYTDLTALLDRLRAYLARVETAANTPGMVLTRTEQDRSELNDLLLASDSTVREARSLIARYELRGISKSRERNWRRIRTESKEVDALSSSLQTHIGEFSTYITKLGLTTTLTDLVQTHFHALPAKIQQSIDGYAAQVRAGTKEGSIMTAYEGDDKLIWRQVRRELYGDGFASTHLHKFKPQIKRYLQKLVESGQLSEDEPDSVVALEDDARAPSDTSDAEPTSPLDNGEGISSKHGTPKLSLQPTCEPLEDDGQDVRPACRPLGEDEPVLEPSTHYAQADPLSGQETTNSRFRLVSRNVFDTTLNDPHDVVIESAYNPPVNTVAPSEEQSASCTRQDMSTIDSLADAKDQSSCVSNQGDVGQQGWAYWSTPRLSHLHPIDVTLQEKDTTSGQPAQGSRQVSPVATCRQDGTSLHITAESSTDTPAGAPSGHATCTRAALSVQEESNNRTASHRDLGYRRLPSQELEYVELRSREPMYTPYAKDSSEVDLSEYAPWAKRLHGKEYARKAAAEYHAAQDRRDDRTRMLSEPGDDASEHVNQSMWSRQWLGSDPSPPSVRISSSKDYSEFVKGRSGRPAAVRKASERPKLSQPGLIVYERDRLSPKMSARYADITRPSSGNTRTTTYVYDPGHGIESLGRRPDTPFLPSRTTSWGLLPRQGSGPTSYDSDRGSNDIPFVSPPEDNKRESRPTSRSPRQHYDTYASPKDELSVRNGGVLRPEDIKVRSSQQNISGRPSYSRSGGVDAEYMYAGCRA